MKVGPSWATLADFESTGQRPKLPDVRAWGRLNIARQERVIRITLVITNIECGGAERVVSLMANYWARRGCEVTLLTFDDGSTPPFFELDSQVRFRPLGIYQASSTFLAAIRNNLRRISVLRRAIRDSRPDVVISFLYFVNVLVSLATRGLGVPVFLSERNDVLMDPLPTVWRWLRRWTYSFKVGVVVLTKQSKDGFSRNIRAKTAIIPNPVYPAPLRSEAPPEGMLNNPSMIAVGSFYPKKGFDLLLQAFAQVKDRHPAWSLTILGDGPLRSDIESLRDELGLQDRVSLLGKVKNPHYFLRQADLFVCSSRWEGLSNALLEAMSCELPVISTNFHFGNNEIVRDGVDGLLVPPENVEALAAAMSRLMSDEAERRRLSRRAVEVTKRFSLEKVMGMWEELLGEESQESNKSGRLGLKSAE